MTDLVKLTLAGAALFTIAMANPLAPAYAADSLPASIISKKTITYCSAMTLPPVTFIDSDLKPAGVDVELGDLLAARLGVNAKWINVPFAGIIPTLIAGQCDAIISSLYIQPARLKVIDEIPYMYASQSVLLKFGTPKLDNINELAGKKVAVVTGSTTNVLLTKTNDDLEKADEKPMEIVSFPDNSDALQQLQFGQVRAFGVQYETAVYYSKKDPSQFELGIAPYYKVPIGIGLLKNEAGLETAIKTALSGMYKDGSYAAVLTKWGIGMDSLSQ